MRPVLAFRVPHKEDIYNITTPGAFFIPVEGDYIYCICPCGCEGRMRLPLYRGESKPEALSQRPAWKWDGNHDTPTLDPSIRDISTCYFHGHLRNGSWSFEGDSGIKS